MECNPTSTRSRANAAFTLAELMISTGVSVLVVTAIGLLAFFSSRSLVAMTNYVDMDQISQLALDKMSREVRQARLVTQCTNTSFTIVDLSGNSVQFLYDANARKLLRIADTATNVYLSDCD